MKKSIRLLSFEMNRFLNFLVPTLLVAATIQLFVTISESLSYKNDLNKLMVTGEATDQIPPFTMPNVTGQGLFELSIVLIVLVFMFYSFFTWYREWQGKNTFIYRLLMLPIDRSHILLTKAGVFLIGGLLAFAFQFGMYFIEMQIVELIIPSSHYIDVHIHNVQPMVGLIQSVLFPTTLFEFISTYSFAFGALFSLFAGILLERSFGLKGLIAGAVYFFGYFILYVVLGRLLYMADFASALRPSQVELLVLAYQFLMIGLGLMLGRWLLKHKVKV